MTHHFHFFRFALTSFALCFVAQTSVQAQVNAVAVHFAETHYTAYESGFKSTEVIVKRSTQKGNLTVHYDIKTQALSGKDFAFLSGKVNFKEGQSEAMIAIHPMTDYRFRPLGYKNKVISLTLTPGADYSVVAAENCDITIIQDPSPKPLPDDATFFSKFDYRIAGLSVVEKAVSNGDYKLARRELAAYYRKRSDPALPYERKAPRKDYIDNVLKNNYMIDAKKFDFGEGKWDSKNWSVPPMSIARFEWWKDLAQAYLDDKEKNSVYASRLFFELDDWLKSSPMDLTIINQLQPGNRWRHLDAGIRMEGAWTQVFPMLKDSPLLSDDLLVDWVKGFYQNFKLLEFNAELSTNRGFSEANGLLIGSTFFHEFLEAAEWKQLALTRMENVLKSDVQNDGSLKELSPGYHNVTMHVVQKFMDFASANKIPLSPMVAAAAEKLFGYYVFAIEPTGNYPLMNDSYKFRSNKQLEFGYANFPHREDFQYLATNGAKGKPPATTSHLFENAGQAVMRSGWTSNDNYLLMDAGPFGTSHGHEDKLSINVDGYGVRHIIDCGPYSYEDANPFRIYSISTHCKSAPLIDDLNQNRRAAKETYAKKSPVSWFVSDKYDYAAGTYGVDPLETWGDKQVRPATTTRHIFYLKPDVWVVMDAFNALDQNQHTYSGLFQTSDDNVGIDQTTKTVVVQLKPGEFDPFSRTTVSTLQPSLSITPLLANGLALTVVKGQERPVISGWQFEKETLWKKQAIPTVRYDLAATGDVQMAYVLAAAPADVPVRKPSITAVATHPGVYGVKVNVGNAAGDTVLLVSLNGTDIVWKEVAYKAKALIIAIENGTEKVTSVPR